MELRVLRYFLAVAREESISGAADVLHITQPTLSRQLMDLEAEVGKQLLIRGSRKLALTDEGLLLRKRAEEILSLVAKTTAELQAPEETVSGDIYIGAGETDVMRLLGKAMRSLQRDYPRIRYHLFSGNADDVTERLDKGLLDFGVLIEPANVQKYEFLRLPAADVWGVLLPKDAPLAASARIRPEDLRDAPLIVSRQMLVGRELSQWLQRDLKTMHIVVTYNLLYNAAIMVEEGLGYALCLDKLLRLSGDSRLCFRPLEPKLEAGLNVVWKKYQVFPKAAELFLKTLQETFASAAV